MNNVERVDVLNATQNLVHEKEDVVRLELLSRPDDLRLKRHCRGISGDWQQTRAKKYVSHAPCDLIIYIFHPCSRPFAHLPIYSSLSTSINLSRYLAPYLHLFPCVYSTLLSPLLMYNGYSMRRRAEQSMQTTAGGGYGYDLVEVRVHELHHNVEAREGKVGRRRQQLPERYDVLVFEVPEEARLPQRPLGIFKIVERLPDLLHRNPLVVPQIHRGAVAVGISSPSDAFFFQALQTYL